MSTPGSGATLIGIDHGFSFPLRYFRQHGLSLDWPPFLGDFLGVAAQAIKLKAVLSGEWVEKADVTRRSADLDSLTDSELLAIVRGAPAQAH